MEIMDAEDTKERIRQLRQRVVSDPSSIGLGQDFSPLTEQRLKSVKSWKPVKQEEISKPIKANKVTTDVSSKTPKLIEEEFENRYLKNLEDDKSDILSKEGITTEEAHLLKQIDFRMENNSKEFLSFFEDKIDKIKKGVISHDMFEEYKERLNQSINNENQELKSFLDSKISNLEVIFSEQNADLAERQSNELVNLSEKVQNEIDSAYTQASVLQTILPDKLAEVENKVVAQFNDKLRALKSEVLSSKDSSKLRTEVIGSELTAQINELEEKVAVGEKKSSDENKSIKDLFDQRINSSVNTLQTDMVENLSHMEREVENLKQGFILENDTLETNLKAKIDDLDQKVVSDLMSVKLPINEKLDCLSSDLLTLKDTSSLRSEAISSDLGQKIRTLDNDIGDLRDSFALKSEAMLSELTFEIDDLKRMIDLTAENSQSADEATRSHLDEQIVTLTSITKSTALEQHEILRKEINNIRNLFALRSDSISADLGVRIDDLKAATDLANEKQQKSSESVWSSFRENIDVTKKSLEKTLDQKLVNIESKLANSEGSLEAQVSKMTSELNAKIEEIGNQVNENATQNVSDIGLLKSFVEEKVKTSIDTLWVTIDNKLKGVEGNITDLMDSFGKEIKEVSLNLSTEIKQIDGKLKSNFEENQKNTQKLFNSFEGNEEKLKYHVEKLETNFDKLERDVADNFKALKFELSDSERRAVGVTKDKYRTLKSLVWVQLDKLKNTEMAFDKALSEIKKNMVTSDSIDSHLLRGIENSQEANKTYFKNELEKIFSLVNTMNNRILSESELTEIFQNHTLNVNIGRNKELLSKVKQGFEKKNSMRNRLFGKRTVAKGLALTILTGCIITLVKALV